MANTVLTVDDLLGDQDCSEQVESLTFEVGLELLEALVSQVEAGELPLEKSLLAYERGVNLLNHLRTLLSGAEEKLEKLQFDPSGNRKKGSSK